MENANISGIPPGEQTCELLGEFGGFGWWLQVNLGGAGLLAAAFEEDVCVWYWINIVVDTTFGVYVQYILLRGARRLLKGAPCLEYGSYGSPPRYAACFAQLMSWQIFCLLMKISAGAFMLALQGPLVFIGSALLASLDTNPNAKLFVVMVATPLVMNSLQYWLTDSFIKNRTPPSREIPVYNVVQTAGDLPVSSSCRRET
ncbi:hypothetical protein, conserved [Eimeria maxima]|uniref:Uncharacterized protein n=1 Tax=Eimeria maxima TaxID=5804 RepID=U6MJ66_EIMMA|nr:hypothetical protein, conserved [Eimeria maxima]CDJ61690.1 hypothetical protein, conserved [Eimeria maxima]